jgi:predicted ATPase
MGVRASEQGRLHLVEISSSDPDRHEHQAGSETFAQQVRDALAHLYDLPYLHTHPLIAQVSPQGSGSTSSAAKQLQQRLITAVEALRPGAPPSASSASAAGKRGQLRLLRRYQVMALRYLEALPVQRVQQQLAISRTEYHRTHHAGLDAVVALLRERWVNRVTASEAAHPLADLEGGQTPAAALPERPEPLLPGHVQHAARQILFPIDHLIGRERELAMLPAWLTGVPAAGTPSPRLVTLTGPPGTGKTQLALHLAAALAGGFADGVCVAPLAPVGDPAHVLAAVATALDLRDNSARSLLEALQATLRTKRLLLVLDNFEHVLEAGPAVAALLAACPHLKVLVTSRAALRVTGEHLFPVPPLAVPDIADLPPPETLLQYPAVALFAQRARAVMPSFQITRDNAAVVAEICIRLDGLPLALELAASRVNLLPPHALLERLDRCLHVLTSGARDAPARQQTLRDTIAWSYDLLTPAEQTLFMRLGIFVGSCVLDAAESVCAGGVPCDGPAPPDGSGDTLLRPPSIVLRPDGILDGLQSLVDKSLVRQEAAHGAAPRYLMLETLREYALERLRAAGALDALRRRHAMHFLVLAHAGERGLHGPEEVAWIARLEQDHDNLRAALQWAMDHDEASLGLQLAYDLFWFWQTRGYQREGRAWVTQLLSLPAAAARTVPRGLALYVAARQAADHGDLATSAALAEEAVSIGREAGDPVITGQALCLIRSDDLASRRAALEEGAALLRSIGHHWTHMPIFFLGESLLRQGDAENARRLMEEAIAFRRQLGGRHMVAIMLRGLSALARHRGDLATAQALFEESVPVFRAMGDRTHLGTALTGLGWLALLRGNTRDAQRLLVDALATAYRTGNYRIITRAIEGLAAAAADQGDPVRALRLATAMDAYPPASQRARDANEDNYLASALQAARQTLSATEQAAARAEGLVMTLDQAVADALEVPDTAKEFSQDINPRTQPPTPTGSPLRAGDGPEQGYNFTN